MLKLVLALILSFELGVLLHFLTFYQALISSSLFLSGPSPTMQNRILGISFSLSATISKQSILCAEEIRPEYNTIHLSKSLDVIKTDSQVEFERCSSNISKS